MSLRKLTEDFETSERASLSFLRFFSTRTNRGGDVSPEKIRKCLACVEQAITICGDLYGRGSSMSLHTWMRERDRGQEVHTLEQKIQAMLKNGDLGRDDVNSILKDVFDFLVPKEQDETAGKWGATSANTIFFKRLIYNLYEIKEEEQEAAEIIVYEQMVATAQKISDSLDGFYEQERIDLIDPPEPNPPEPNPPEPDPPLNCCQRMFISGATKVFNFLEQYNVGFDEDDYISCLKNEGDASAKLKQS